MKKLLVLFTALCLSIPSIGIASNSGPRPQEHREIMPAYRPEIMDSIVAANSSFNIILAEPQGPSGLNEPGDSPIFQYLKNKPRITTSLSSSAFPDGFKILALALSFPDKTFAPVSTPAFWDSVLFYDGPASQALTALPRSVTEYYQEQSQGSLTLITVNSIVTVGIINMPANYSSYVNNAYGLGAYPNNTQKMCEDAIAIANPLVDFSQYDNDKSGYTDGLVLIHPGRGAEFSGSTADIWSHKWGVSPKRYDNVWVSAFSIQPEYWNAPGDITIGVYAHEIGHLFGLPDLYDTDGSSRGLGIWSLMAGGSWNGTLGNNPGMIGAEEAYQLGLKTPIDISTDTTLILYPEHNTNKFIRFLLPGSTQKYYTLTWRFTRTPTSWQKRGLMIQRVNRTQTTNTKEWYPGRETLGNYRVAVMQAGNGWGLEKNTTNGLSTDPYVEASNTIFSPHTKPSAKFYDGTNPHFKLYGAKVFGTDSVQVKVEICADCPFQGDLNADGAITYDDALMVDSIAFNGAPDIRDATCSISRADLNCNGTVDMFDVVTIVRYLQAQNNNRPLPVICRSCR